MSQNKKITVITLFAGGGGSALGFEKAGLKHTLLNEIDENAIKTLKRNRPRWNVIKDDITRLNFKGIKADIVEAGFPCQSFSYAGKEKGIKDKRGALFQQFARCIKEVKPKIVIGENVKGLLTHNNGQTFQKMIKTLTNLGYKVDFKILKARHFDVPQERERLIIFATRKDLNLPIIFPVGKNNTITLRQALKNCPNSKGSKYPSKKQAIMNLIPEGGNWRNLPLSLQKKYMGKSFFNKGGKTGIARRLSWSKLSPTLTCYPAQKQTERCHPDITRPLTIREYARIQTFPDTWEFTGSLASQYQQIGNAVPVNLAFHLGKAIISILQKENTNP